MSSTHHRGQPNWVGREAAKADLGADRVVLENPDVVGSLDSKLRETYLPFIRAELEKTGFPYQPVENDLHIDSQWMGPYLARALPFMLFDHFGQLFMRCTLLCSSRGHLLEREISSRASGDNRPSAAVPNTRRTATQRIHALADHRTVCSSS